MEITRICSPVSLQEQVPATLFSVGRGGGKLLIVIEGDKLYKDSCRYDDSFPPPVSSRDEWSYKR